MLSIVDGLQVPEIPLTEVAGNTGAVLPEHNNMDVPKENVGVIFGLTVTVKVTGIAQIPDTGVNV